MLNFNILFGPGTGFVRLLNVYGSGSCGVWPMLGRTKYDPNPNKGLVSSVLRNVKTGLSGGVIF